MLSTHKDLFEKRIHVMEGLKDADQSREVIRAAIKETINKGTLDLTNQFSFKFEAKRKEDPELLN